MPTSRSLPILRGSSVQEWSRFTDPEEEVFSLSLETEQSPGWQYMDTSSSSSGSVFNLSRLVSPLKGRARPSVTPGRSREGKRRRLVSPPAPKKQKRGRASQLQRYVHKYSCEDYMEYAVDSHQWKVSLEESYQVRKCSAPTWPTCSECAGILLFAGEISFNPEVIFTSQATGC